MMFDRATRDLATTAPVRKSSAAQNHPRASLAYVYSNPSAVESCETMDGTEIVSFSQTTRDRPVLGSKSTRATPGCVVCRPRVLNTVEFPQLFSTRTEWFSAISELPIDF